jgi:type IV secretion system protein VirB4
MNSLKKYRTTKPGLSTLLNYAAVIDDGVILNKDGSLMAAWYYRGSDNASATDEERNSLSARVNAALARLGSGWMTHHDAIRVPSRGYPVPISRLIDDERRAQFESEGAHFESHYVLIVTYLPPMKQQSKVADLMFDDNKRAKSTVADRTLSFFKQAVAELEDSLAGSVSMQRMRGRPYEDDQGNRHIADDFLQYLHFAITGENHRINLPPVPMYLDAIIGGQDFFSGLTPKIGERFILPITIDGFPMESYPGILSVLDQLPMMYRWSTRFIYLDSHAAKAELTKYQKKWKQKVRGFVDQVFQTSKGNVDHDAADMANDVENALSEASSGLVTYGFYTTVIVLMHEDRDVLETCSRDVRKAVQDLGFNCRFESVNAVDAWLGTLPGHGVPNLRRPMMHTMNLADLLPLSSIWPGNPTCPCPFYPPDSPPLLYAATEGATPFRFNLHVSDLGHSLVLGPPGSGKSTLLALILGSFLRYPDATIYAFDKGRSLTALVNACGGVHHDIAGENSTLKFAPLSEIQDERERGWAEGWIASLFELQDVHLTPEIRNEIHRCMRLLAQAPAEERNLTTFQGSLQSDMLRAALDPYTLSGSSHMLDAAVDGLKLSRFQVFEIEDLMNLGDDRIALPILTYLFHRIEKSLKGQPAILAIDEAWLMLSHKVFRAKIQEWLKVLRKANCIVLLATQSLSDAAKSGILDVLLESCPTKILLPNTEADQRGSGGVTGPRDFYAMMGLNRRQNGITISGVLRDVD